MPSGAAPRDELRCLRCVGPLREWGCETPKGTVHVRTCDACHEDRVEIAGMGWCAVHIHECLNGSTLFLPV